MTHRPFAVTVLSILAGVSAFLAAIHLLQALAILPYFLGPIAVRAFDPWYAIMWGLMVWVWSWLARMLWQLDPSAWIYLVIISVFNILVDFIALVGSGGTLSDASLGFLLNGLVLVYAILPSTRRAFGIDAMSGNQKGMRY